MKIISASAPQGAAADDRCGGLRLGSPLDSVIEVLDAQGNAIPRATIRCLNQTTTTLSDRDSRTTGVRLTSTSGLHVGDYLMIGDELDQIEYIADQPDDDTDMRGIGGLRQDFLGTSPVVHAVNSPVYRAQILPPDAEFPSDGLPVFRLTWRNDDGGPGYGADSRIDFVAPADGEYVLHLKTFRHGWTRLCLSPIDSRKCSQLSTRRLSRKSQYSPGRQCAADGFGRPIAGL